MLQLPAGLVQQRSGPGTDQHQAAIGLRGAVPAVQRFLQADLLAQFQSFQLEVGVATRQRIQTQRAVMAWIVVMKPGLFTGFHADQLLRDLQPFRPLATPVVT